MQFTIDPSLSIFTLFLLFLFIFRGSYFARLDSWLQLRSIEFNQFSSLGQTVRSLSLSPPLFKHSIIDICQWKTIDRHLFLSYTICLLISLSFSFFLSPSLSFILSNWLISNLRVNWVRMLHIKAKPTWRCQRKQTLKLFCFCSSIVFDCDQFAVNCKHIVFPNSLITC